MSVRRMVSYSLEDDARRIRFDCLLPKPDSQTGAEQLCIDVADRGDDATPGLEAAALAQLKAEVERRGFTAADLLELLPVWGMPTEYVSLPND